MMNRLRFPLSSDQLELLLGFENRTGLASLAEEFGRDPSVISRSLQKIAEEHPVLVKINGRWELTPLGRQLNETTRSYLAKQSEILASQPKEKALSKSLASAKSVLIVINAQAGLLDATQEGRNNSEAERNIASLLELWRQEKRPILHVKHVSDSPSSLFYRLSAGSDFLPLAAPRDHEEIIEKMKSSAFSETRLFDRLNEIDPDHLFIVGFTANECIDATAKDAASLGLTSFVVGDATAMFDLRGLDGKLIKAERVHRLTLANINATSAKVIQTKDLFTSV